MTSKISFSKLCIENLKHRVALIFAMIAIFLIELLGIVINIQNVFAEYQGPTLVNRIETITEPSMAIGIPVIFIGVALAFDAFKKLHSRKMTDFYDSLPVKRQTEFTVYAVNSMLMFAIPAILLAVLEIVIVSVFGCASATVISNVLWTLILSILAFAAVWLTATLAIIMTGHALIGLLGFGVFASYMPVVLRYLIPSYQAAFFSTYVGGLESGDFLNYFSPVSLTAKMFVDYDGWDFASHSSAVFGTVIMIIVLTVLCYVLYAKRPAEAAGRAMAFEKINTPLRFILVIPATLYAGIYLLEMSIAGSILWVFTGIVVGGFIFHAIVECIYQFDIRGITSHLVQMVITIVICLVFSGFFIMDFFHYDQWVPERSKVETVYLKDGFLGGEMDDVTSLRTPGIYQGKNPADGLHGENVDVVLSMIKDIVDNQLDDGKVNTLMADVMLEQDNASRTDLTVTYEMTDGKIVKRMYFVNKDKLAKYLDEIYVTEDYKNDVCKLYSIDRDTLKTIAWDNTIDNMRLKLSKEDSDRLMDTYLEEFTKISYSEVKDNMPVGTIIFEFMTASPDDMERFNTSECFVYPSFHNTINLLKEYGVEKLSIMDDYNLTELEIIENDDDYNTIADYVVTDTEVLEKYRKDLKPLMYSYMSGYVNESKLTVTATVRDERGNAYYIDVEAEEAVILDLISHGQSKTVDEDW